MNKPRASNLARSARAMVPTVSPLASSLFQLFLVLLLAGIAFAIGRSGWSPMPRESPQRDAEFIGSSPADGTLSSRSTDSAPSHQPKQRTDVGKAARKSDSVTHRDVVTWPFWEHQLEEPVVAREQPLTPPDWRLLGAVLVDGRWQVVVVRQGSQQPEYFAEGATLPGRYRIKRITQEDVTFALGARDLTLTYFAAP